MKQSPTKRQNQRVRYIAGSRIEPTLQPELASDVVLWELSLWFWRLEVKGSVPKTSHQIPAEVVEKAKRELAKI